MIRVSELRKWLDTLEPDDLVGIDDGGLTMELVCEEAEASEDDSCYIEIGGMPAEEQWTNYYLCPNDSHAWSDDWSCQCNDRCPQCDAEIEPYASKDADGESVIHSVFVFEQAKALGVEHDE